MSTLQLFMPCAGGAEDLLAAEVAAISGREVRTQRGGVALGGDMQSVERLNLHSRIAQRVLVQVAHAPYRQEQDLYDVAQAVAWEDWFTTRQTFKIEMTAQHSPLKSLNFAGLKVKDAIADRFRDKTGARPTVETRWPDIRVFGHLTADHLTLYVDTSGEPLFKRGWREDKGEAPLKETLAAAMLAASGWDASVPLYDPCCGSGTIAIEAAQRACNVAPGLLRRFAFEKFVGFAAAPWQALREEARAAQRPSPVAIHGSDIAFRMMDFANRNAERAGVAGAVQFRGGDALQRMPPTDVPGVLVLNPPYGERIEAAGIAGPGRGGREAAQMEDPGDFFAQLATHWKKNYAGWTAWMLSPDMKLPTRMRLKESRRVPMWNGPIECRLFRFDMVRGSARAKEGGDAARGA